MTGLAVFLNAKIRDFIFLIKREDTQSSLDAVEIKSANEQISSSLSPERESSQALLFTPNHFLHLSFNIPSLFPASSV